MAFDLSRVRQRASKTLSGYSSGQRAVIAVAAVALVIGGVLFTRWSSQPRYVTLFSNLEPSDASAITDKLNSKKIPFHLADGGASIEVPSKDVYQTRLDLSAAGLPNGGNTGYALLDKQGITTSEFRQRVDYQRALEGELAKTINAIDGVSTVSVHLVVPPQDVFATSTSPSSASVLVKMVPGKTLTSTQAQTVVHLVSSSVEGLKPQDVTVADTRGVVLSNQTDGTTAESQADAVHAYETRVSQSLQTMLGRVLGPDHAVVQVTADLDLNQRQKTTESYDNSKPSQAVNEATTKETFTGSGAAVPGGVLGADTASTIAGTAGSGNSNYAKDEATRNYAIGKTVEEVKTAPGTVNRMSVAVLLDANAPATDTAQVEQLVRAAAGLQDQRGDTIAVTRMPFDQSAAKDAAQALASASKNQHMKSLVDIARAVVALLAVLFTVVMLLRRSRTPQRLPLPLPLPSGETASAQLAAINSDIDLTDEPAAELGAPATRALEPRRPLPEFDRRALEDRSHIQRQVGDLIERQPEEVAQLLRSWLADRRS